jgi:hypothetical protein
MDWINFSQNMEQHGSFWTRYELSFPQKMGIPLWATSHEWLCSKHLPDFYITYLVIFLVNQVRCSDNDNITICL